MKINHLEIRDFNQNLKEHLNAYLETKPQTLKSLTFGDNFNKSLPNNLPDSIQTIIFIDSFYNHFNKPLPENYPEN